MTSAVDDTNEAEEDEAVKVDVVKAETTSPEKAASEVETADSTSSEPTTPLQEDATVDEGTTALQLSAYRREIDRLQAETSDYRELLRRKQAEFENFRKRTEREKQDFVKFAAAELVREILTVVDNLERAIEASKNTAEDGEDQLREGVAIIYRQFRDILGKQGLKEVEALHQPFDPHVHEAVSRVETSEHPDETVLEVFQTGYLFGDRLLRPSMVSVASNPSAPPDAGVDDEDDDEEGDELGDRSEDGLETAASGSAGEDEGGDAESDVEEEISEAQN